MQGHYSCLTEKSPGLKCRLKDFGSRMRQKSYQCLSMFYSGRVEAADKRNRQAKSQAKEAVASEKRRLDKQLQQLKRQSSGLLSAAFRTLDCLSR